jgi:hypothetical protein
VLAIDAFCCPGKHTLVFDFKSTEPGFSKGGARHLLLVLEINQLMAEREGFEPAVRITAQRLSSSRACTHKSLPPPQALSMSVLGGKADLARTCQCVR